MQHSSSDNNDTIRPIPILILLAIFHSPIFLLNPSISPTNNSSSFL